MWEVEEKSDDKEFAEGEGGWMGGVCVESGNFQVKGLLPAL